MLNKIIQFLKKLFSTETKVVVENPELNNPVSEHVNLSELEKKCLEFYGSATKEIGINESKNPDRIKLYHSSVGLKAGIDTAWCSSFANYIVKQSKIKATGSALARSWLKWGKSVDTPIKGCLVVFWRKSPSSSYGHVGFYAGETETDIIVIGGNQSNSVCKAKYPKSRLLGYRVPIL